MRSEFLSRFGWFFVILVSGLSVARSQSSWEFASRIWKGQFTVPIRGERYYFFDYGKGRQIQREFVAVKPEKNGKVKFHLELVGIVYTQNLSGDPKGRDNEELRRALFEMREGANFLYRDFRIKNLDVALRNYDFKYFGEKIVAGRPCKIVEVKSKNPFKRRWEVSMDLETGAVLGYKEYAGDDRLVSGMEYIEGRLKLGKNVSFDDIKRWWKPSLEVGKFSSIKEAEKAFGHDIIIPYYMPREYFMYEIRITKTKTGNLFAVVEYTDGLDTLFVVNSEPDPMAKTRTVPDGTAIVLHKYTIGPAVQIWAEVFNRTIMVLGRSEHSSVEAIFETIYSLHK